MRFFNIFTAAFAILFLLPLHGQDNEKVKYYGEEFKLLPVSTATSEMDNKLMVSDTVATQLRGKIKEVCQAKGCWMQVVLEDQREVFVRFKDYGFFVPTDSADKEVVMNGKLFTEKISIEEQKHYAKDRGDSDEEIAKIDSTKEQLRFEANGVLIRPEN